MRLANTVQDWLDEKGWEDVIERDEVAQTSQCHMFYRIHNQRCELFIETDEPKDWITLYFYLPFNARADKRTDVICLCNRLNATRSRFGSLQVLPSGRIRFRHTLDVEGAELSTIVIQRMLESAAHLVEIFMSDLAAVALTSLTAQAVFERLDQIEETGATS